MRSDYDLLIVTTSRLDNPVTAPIYSLAKEFARTNRIFYIEHPYTWKDYWQGKNDPIIKGKKEALTKGTSYYRHLNGWSKNLYAITPELTLPINWLPDGALYDTLAKRNDAVLFRTVMKTLKEFDVKKFILINSFDPFFGRFFPKDFKPILDIYQTIDSIAGEPYIARHGVRLEAEHARRADIFLTTSKKLQEQYTALTPNARQLSNGVDLEVFEKAVSPPAPALPRPADMKDLKGKIICYFGHLDSLRIDFELMKKSALAYPDIQFVYIGPIHGEEYKERGLDKLPNVHFLGRKPFLELPAYLQHVDATIIPYKLNDLTSNIYPLKFNECLALGKPVIVTHFSKDLEDYADGIYIARDADHFVSLLNTALYHDTPERYKDRWERSRANSWENRAEQFWKIVEPFLQAKEGKQVKVV